MLRSLIISIVALVCGQAQAAPLSAAFTCTAHNDTWSVSGTPDRRMTCNFRCILAVAPQGQQDSVSCNPSLSPATSSTVVCEGFLRGRHWTSATLVAADCSAAQ